MSSRRSLNTTWPAALVVSGVVPPVSVPGAMLMLMASDVSGLPNLSAACTVIGLRVTPAVVLLGWLK